MGRLYKAGDAYTKSFLTYDPATGEAIDADATPTGTLLVNGVANGATVTITQPNTATGEYMAAATLPGAAGDNVELRIAATIDGTTYVAVVDAVRLVAWTAGDLAGTGFDPDLHSLKAADDAALAAMDVIGTPAGASVAADIAAAQSDLDTLTTRIPGTVQPQTGDAYARLGANGAGLTAIPSVGGVTGNITGNLSGSVGSVTGAVGSVTGNVGGNVAGSVGSVTGAVASVTGNVGGNVTGSVGSIAGVTFPAHFSDLAITAGDGEVTATNGGSGGLDADGVRTALGLTDDADLPGQLAAILSAAEAGGVDIPALLAAWDDGALPMRRLDNVTAPTRGDGLAAATALLAGDKTKAGTTITVKHLDGTTAAVRTLDDATNPTSAT